MDAIIFKPLMEVKKDWLVNGEYLQKLSRELKERGFPDFIMDENGKDPESVTILVSEKAFAEIIDVHSDSISQQVCWKKGGEYF